jgi:hypothetical protein
MTNAQIGFVRGLGYAVLAAVCSFIVGNLGGSGIVDPAVSAVIVAIAAAVEHAFTA